MTIDELQVTTRSNVSEPGPNPYKLLRLHVTSDGDPSVLPRLLGLFQNLNVTPRAVLAEFGIDALMHLSIDVCGLHEARLNLIAGKIGQTPCVHNAYWHYLI
jgi:hypothetical protein